MRENNRKPIEKCRRKLSQFTTMNVIDGQAGLVIYSSLIFYSLTIDNILNIVVLLILAGVTIASITGENGILTKVQMAKINTEEAEKEEMEKFNKLEEEMHGNITGELFLQYDIEYSVNKEYAKIMVYPRIGGIPRLQTYEEYINPKKELEGKSYDEKKEIFFNYEREYFKEYYEETYPGQEITEELILSSYDVSTIDELCQNNGVESIDEYIMY